MVNVFIAIICGYLLGSIPSAYIAARLKKNIDIRDVGSKNMGTLNVYYEVGLMEAALVLLADVGKGIGAILLARYWLEVSLVFQLFAGLAAVLGHAFPVFLKFHGGKGGATTIAILLFFMPRAIPFFLVIAATALLLTHNYVFCYAVAFICFPLVAGLIYHSTPLVAFSTGLPILVGINYIPRLKEMYVKAGGDWRKVIKRGGLKERL